MFITEYILAAPVVPFIVQAAISMAVAYAAYYIAAAIAGKSRMKMPEASNYPVQTSMKGIPKPKIYGTVRTAGEIIWIGELHPYTVEHETGGKGGAGGQVTEETRYRRSFLISVCEGTATISRIWVGKKEISLVPEQHHTWGGTKINAANITLFDGENNSGIKTLTGEDYGEYRHNCCAFFEEYDLGNVQSLPNFVFEVRSHPGYLKYFVGITDLSNGNILVKCNSNSEIDTLWGDNGYFNYTDPVTGDMPYFIHDMIQLDGRILISTDGFAIDAVSGQPGCRVATLIMINLDGTIDDTWGYNGFYAPLQTASYLSNIKKILQDSDGNFHIFGQVGYPGGGYLKLDSNGTEISNLFATNYTTLYAFNDARWYDDDKTRIIAVGAPNNISKPLGGYAYANVVAIDPATGTKDTTWPGNAACPSAAIYLSSASLLSVRRLTDGFVIYQNGTPTMAKFDVDGIALDAGWGSSGTLDIGTFSTNPSNKCIDLDGDEIYAISYRTIGGQNNVVFSYIDANGIVQNSYNKVADAGSYVGINLYNNKIIFTTAQGSDDDVEIWDTDFNYESGFDVGAVNYTKFALPDIFGYDYDDVNPAWIIRDMAANTRYGARISDSLFCNDCYLSAYNYWAEKGMLLSINMNEAKPWQDWCDFILSHVGGGRHFNGGLFHIGALKDEASAFALTDDDLVQPSADSPKVKIMKRPYSETYNRIEVVWTDRANGYGEAVAVAQDEVDQRVSGQIRKRTVALPGIMNATLAAYMVQRLLIDALYRYNIFEFIVGYKRMLLENGDVGTLSDGELISGEKIRIMKVSEDVHGRGLSITAIEELAGLYPDLTYSTQANLHNPDPAITLMDAGINFREDYNDYKLYLSLTPGNSSANGWHIYKSYDNVTYQWIGRCGINGVTGGDANSQGTITSNLPEHGSETWSKDEAVLVSIGTVTDLASASEADFWSDRKLAKIGSEIIAYKTAEETAVAGTWRITNLRRGLFGTEPVAHSSGDAFCTLDPDFTYRYSPAEIGKTIYFKALTFYGDNIQATSEVTGFNYQIEGLIERPAAASLLRLTSNENEGGSNEYSGASFTLYWNLGSRVSGFNYGDWLNLPWNNYIADSELQAVVLKFETEAGVAIGQREIAVGSSTAITKATDLGGNDRAVIRVVPRRTYESKLQNKILVESI